MHFKEQVNSRYVASLDRGLKPIKHHVGAMTELLGKDNRHQLSSPEKFRKQTFNWKERTKSTLIYDGIEHAEKIMQRIG